MTTTINASTSAGLVQTADTSGVLALQTAGTTAVTIDASQNVGVGTATPTFSLGGGIQVKNSTFSNVRVTSGAFTGVDFAQYGADGNGYLYNRDNCALIFGTNNTERMRVNSGAPVLCLAGGNQNATGTGIAFPATQSASSDANTLDDYEEGTWTPTDASGAGLSLTVNTTSNYVKIGSMVYACCSITFPVTANAAQVSIGGLPFTSGGSGSGFWGGATRYTTFSQITMVAVAPSSASFQGYLPSGAALTNTQAGTLRFDFAFSYRVA